MKHIFHSIIFLMPLWVSIPAAGQISHPVLPEQIAVTARPFIDSILLRWAPLDYKVWQSGNIHGYRIERYVLVRNSNFLPRPEKTILHSAIKPWAEDKWESLVQNNKYAAIAAQALYGDSFEVDLKQSDIFTIVDKVHENEQRFAFALFSADMSKDVAEASALWFADNQVKEGEKYLYRVVVNSMDSLRGSIYLSPDDPYELLKPQNFQADFKDNHVSLKWDKSTDTRYTAYVVERSDDGKYFSSISESPLVTVSPTASEDTRYEYAIDSLMDFSMTHHYRVKGITPFGEISPPSDIVSGKGTKSVNQVPYISAVESKNNNALLIQWVFPETHNDAIRGFAIERASKPKENFSPLTGNILSARSRVYLDRSPRQVNYYRVVAHAEDGRLYSSQVYFAQLVDSIPPACPVGLEGKIYESGKVHLSWTRNPEPDIFGYRIYKAYHESEELAQVTTEPITVTLFNDLVDLNTLNETIYYRVMAVDINQNHSSLSELLKLTLPDKVNPQPPVFLPVESNDHGVLLHWIPGSSEDILRYKIYRKAHGKAHGKAEWQLLKEIQNTADTLYHYLDTDAIQGTINYYTAVAVDEAGLESEPAHPVSGSIIDPGLRLAIAWKKPLINREQNHITLSWIYTQPGIRSFRIFRGVHHRALILFKTLSGDKREFTDTMIPGLHYRYRIMVLFEDGNKSYLSEEMEFQY